MTLTATALRRPVTVAIVAVALLIVGGIAVIQGPRDILPLLNTPTIYVAQPYGGMDPSQMEGYLTYYYEYHFLYITGIQHVESKSIQSAALIKLQFHPGTEMAQAMAETVQYVNRARAFMPPGTLPPFVMRFDSGSLPVGNLVFSSRSRKVGELQDAALNLVRPLFATLSGVSAPPPFGGSARTIVINANPERLRAYGMSVNELVETLASTNVIAPSGNLTLGNEYPIVPVNSVVRSIRELESVPVRTGTIPAVFLRDVATVSDGSDIVTGYALVNGRRTVYIPVTKRADASTLSVVAEVKRNLPRFQNVLPADITVDYELDQSPLVTSAIDSLLREAALGGLLTSLMVLFWLRDWRATLIVLINIPLALLAAQVALMLTGQTVNVMTLGGLALAIGILVDEITVCLENIHVHLAQNDEIAESVLTASNETNGPRLLALACVIAMFSPVMFMYGTARAMFIPLSLAVGFSMMASYVLSSTLVPVLAVMLGGKPQTRAAAAGDAGAFSRFRNSYVALLTRVVRWPRTLAFLYLLVALTAIAELAPRLGTEIMPRVDTQQMRVRLRAAAGSSIDTTEKAALAVLDIIAREAGGADNVAVSIGLVGVHPPSYPINLIYLWSAGTQEATLDVQFKRTGPTNIEGLQERVRQRCATELPNVDLSFEPADMVSRVMSMGAPTPIEVAVTGPSLADDRAFAEKVRIAVAALPQLRDVQFGQALDYPSVQVEVDRARAGMLGMRMTDVTRALGPATSSSRYVVPNYWADPTSGIAYQVQVQIPALRMASIEELRNVMVGAHGDPSQLLRNISRVSPGSVPGEIDRYNGQRTVSITANLAASDLGTATKAVQRAIENIGAPPPKVSVTLRGEVEPLAQILAGMRTGLWVAIGAIFLLLVGTLQSTRLALVVMSVLPAALAGVVGSLWVTHTTLNIQSFTGTVMSMGVAVANAILLVMFAARAQASLPRNEAIIEGAQARLRPILMTSLAMLAGMLPMAVGWGESANQSAALARAVIGGLAAATAATLLVVPAMYAVIAAREARNPSLLAERSATPRL